jgi:hypothetical protein
MISEFDFLNFIRSLTIGSNKVLPNRVFYRAQLNKKKKNLGNLILKNDVSQDISDKNLKRSRNSAILAVSARWALELFKLNIVNFLNYLNFLKNRKTEI